MGGGQVVYNFPEKLMFCGISCNGSLGESCSEKKFWDDFPKIQFYIGHFFFIDFNANPL